MEIIALVPWPIVCILWLFRAMYRLGLFVMLLILWAVGFYGLIALDAPPINLLLSLIWLAAILVSWMGYTWIRRSLR